MIMNHTTRFFVFFFFNDTATTEIYTLSLHDALPISLFVEAERGAAASYPRSSFPEGLSWLVDEERRAAYESAGSHFESSYQLTILWLPPAEAKARAARIMLETPAQQRVDWRENLAAFIGETERFRGLLEGAMTEIAWLDNAETLTYLHATVSTNAHAVAVPETPFALDALLADRPLSGGLAPMLGDAHLRCLSVRGFPTSTWPGLLDDLNRLGFAYRWVTRFLFMSKSEAERELVRLRPRWFAERKGGGGPLAETSF